MSIAAGFGDKNQIIREQAERIKELEAAYESASARATLWQQNYQDLRQRIDDAPVVAWKHGEYLFNAHCHDERFLSAEGISLVKREDLL